MKNIKAILFFIFVIGASAVAIDLQAQTEIQQQLDSVSSTLDTVGTQIASVKEKGIVQTIWDNATAPIAVIWQQITGIFGQITGIFSTVSK
ncbi:MAG: hypothetical protein WA093_03370 [Minisyncoccales bacterium]